MKNMQTKQWVKNAATVAVVLMLLWSTALAAPTDAPPAPRELTLDEAVKMALASNPTGKIAVFDFEAAKGALTAARSGRWPTVGGTHTDARSLAAPSITIPNPIETDRYSNTVSASWVLWSGNKVESQVSQAKLALDSSQWGIAKARQQLKFDATTGYFNLMGARDAVKLSQESVERLENYLRDTKLQFEVGVVAKVDVLRSEVELANARQDLIVAQNTYALAMAKLNNIIGLPLATELSVKGDLTYINFETDLATTLDTALRQRPEISQSTDAAKSAQEAITIAKAGYLPTVSATYSNNWNDTAFAGGNNYNWTVYLSTNWTFLDSGLTAGKVKQAVEGYHKAQEQLKQTVDGVRLEVRSTYLSLKAAGQAIQTSSAAVGLAEEDYKIKVIRYQAGVGTNLDVLDAQVALTKAKNNFLKAMYSYNTLRAQIDKEMGVPVK